MRTHGRRRGRRAFSLIETLAALAIFSVAVVGLIEGIAATLRHWRLAEEQARGLRLAQSLMEETLAASELAPAQDSGRFEPPDERFQWESSIEQTETEGLFRVQARVFWQSAGHEREAALATLRADRNRPLLQYEPQGEGGGQGR